MALAAPAAAQQVLMQNELAQVAVDAYAAPATLGSRAQVGLKLGPVNASLKAAVERGGGGMAPTAQAWAAVSRPSTWTGDNVEFGAVWSPAPTTRITLDAGDRERQTLNFGNPLTRGSNDQLVTDQARFLRVNATAKPLEKLEVRLGGEASLTEVESFAINHGATSSRSALWTEVRKIFTSLTWRPAQKVTVEAGQSVQTLGVAWRGAHAQSAAAAEDAYVTPSLAVTLTPWRAGKWRMTAEQTVQPVNPWQFASFAQVGGASAGSTLQPDEGWRYGVRLEQQLAKGVNLTANLSDWRLESVTELGPVGASEAAVSIGAAERRKLDVNLSAPLEPLGLDGAKLTGQVTWQWSEVADPFTGAERALSGETPYQAQLKLGGSVYGRDLSWSVVAQASGPQSVYQMRQVTELSPTAGLGGALTYGAGPVRVSLEVDNLLGGERTVTSVRYPGSRAAHAPVGVSRRKDETRAVRLALKRRL